MRIKLLLEVLTCLYWALALAILVGLLFFDGGRPLSTPILIAVFLIGLGAEIATKTLLRYLGY